MPGRDRLIEVRFVVHRTSPRLRMRSGRGRSNRARVPIIGAPARMRAESDGERSSQ